MKSKKDFCIDLNNVDYLMSIGEYKYDKVKQQILKDLYFKKDNKVSVQTKRRLRSVWW